MAASDVPDDKEALKQMVSAFVVAFSEINLLVLIALFEISSW